VRWLSVEALTDNKFSRASDVWSFGVLVYEVMSRGAVPYSDCATLVEVAAHIKAGHTMSCPDGCAPQVHARVMAPCWQLYPPSRPRFRDLLDVLVMLGAVPYDSVGSTARVASDNTDDYEGGELIIAPLNCPRELLGPSIHHIHDVLVPKVMAAVRPPWKNKKGRIVAPAESATISDSVEAVVIPTGADGVCPRDGKAGCAYVDTLCDRDSVGRATALLSCESPPPPPLRLLDRDNFLHVGRTTFTANVPLFLQNLQ
jgi:serine/threonine protein kinase